MPETMAVINPSPPIKKKTKKGTGLGVVSKSGLGVVTLINIAIIKLNIQTAAPMIAIIRAFFVSFLKKHSFKKPKQPIVF
jgi:hypothetical protein